HAIADQVVDQQHGGGADRPHRLDGQQLRVARACADQRDAASMRCTHALISAWGFSCHASSARRMHSDCWASGDGAGFSPLTTDWMYSAVVAASVTRGSTGSSVSTPSCAVSD